MNIAIVELECTLEERAQARKRLALALAAMLKQEIMLNSTLLAYGKESDVNGPQFSDIGQDAEQKNASGRARRLRPRGVTNDKASSHIRKGQHTATDQIRV